MAAYTIDDLERARADAHRWMERSANDSSNNPNKQRSAIKRANEEVAAIESYLLSQGIEVSRWVDPIADQRPPLDFPPAPGQVFNNYELSRCFLVGVQGGMRRSTKRDLLVLISDPFKGLYQDRWIDETLHYTGMGPRGQQDLEYAQNKTLAQSPATAIPLHLFEVLEEAKYTYVGIVELAGAPYQEEQFDDLSINRKVWMFPVKLKSGKVPALSSNQARAIEAAQSKQAHELSFDELRKRAAKATGRPAKRQTNVQAFVRDAAVSEFAKRCANGHCDLCKAPAPFSNKNGPYLECHHIEWLSRGGPDEISNTVALCPNCHSKMHELDDNKDRSRLLLIAQKRARLVEGAELGQILEEPWQQP